ncbi:MAG: hypothetical protein ACAI25_10975, partial [Planctomycetota bacterium]
MRLSLNKLAVLLVTLVLGASALASGDPRSNARELSARAAALASTIETALVDSAALPGIRAKWDEFADRWLQLDDPIRALSPDRYRLIEERMFDVTGALPRQGEWQLEDARRALGDIKAACDVIAALPAAESGPRGIEIADFVATTRAAQKELAAGRLDAAFASVNEAWFKVESRVSALDRNAYVACEGLLVEARVAVSRRDAPALGDI